MSNLTSAIMIAAEMHEDQTDKAGEPYILHPLRVMLSMATEDERIVAVLHDVVEDNEDGGARIYDAAFDARILDAIDALTRRDDESYAEFIERCRENPLAARVKIADIRDNLSPSRSASLPTGSRKKYMRALVRLVCAVKP